MFQKLYYGLRVLKKHLMDQVQQLHLIQDYDCPMYKQIFVIYLKVQLQGIKPEIEKNGLII